MTAVPTPRSMPSAPRWSRTVLAHSLLGVVDPARSAADLPDAAVAVYEAVRYASRPVVVAELAARQRLPLGVAVVLASDLVHRGLLRPAQRPPVPCPKYLVERVLDGLRR